MLISSLYSRHCTLGLNLYNNFKTSNICTLLCGMYCILFTTLPTLYHLSVVRGISWIELGKPSCVLLFVHSVDRKSNNSFALCAVRTILIPFFCNLLSLPIIISRTVPSHSLTEFLIY